MGWDKLRHTFLFNMSLEIVCLFQVTWKLDQDAGASCAHCKMLTQSDPAAASHTLLSQGHMGFWALSPCKVIGSPSAAAAWPTLQLR